MKKLSNSQGSILILLILLVLAVIFTIGTVTYKIKYRNKPTATDTTSQQQAAQTPPPQDEAQTQYLEIREFAVKMPLSDLTKTATYKLDEGGWAAIYVDVEGDSTGNCRSQLAIHQFKTADEISQFQHFFETSDLEAEFNKLQKVKDMRYIAEPANGACSESMEVQNRATNIRNQLIKDAQKLEILESAYF